MMPVAPRYEADPSEFSHQPRRVLLAEDDPAMRATLVHHLVRCGFDVEAVEDGLQLATQLDELADVSIRPAISAIVSDIRMPGASGLRILEWLRSRRNDIPVILITGFGRDEVKREAERLGATLLEKPFDPVWLSQLLNCEINDSQATLGDHLRAAVVPSAPEEAANRRRIVSNAQPHKPNPTPVNPAKTTPAAPTPAKGKPAQTTPPAPTPKR